MEIAQTRIQVQLDQVTAERAGKPKWIESLIRIVNLVSNSDSGGASALAPLLMSCYNGSEYPFDITELCRLDDEYFEDALNLIRLRTRCGHEPHEFFVLGGKLFEQIAADFGIHAECDRANPSRKS